MRVLPCNSQSLLLMPFQLLKVIEVFCHRKQCLRQLSQAGGTSHSSPFSATWLSEVASIEKGKKSTMNCVGLVFFNFLFFSSDICRGP